MIATGLDRLLSREGALAGREYGLLAHGAAVSAELVPAHLALALSGHPPSRLFGPEHGYYGVEQDMVASSHTTDPWTGVAVRSLYGDSITSLRPEPGAFEGLDLLLVDLQDVGARYYTFAATAVWAAQVALEAGCEVWVLDRPNPLGGDLVEGNIRAPAFASFVGAFEHPALHGLTLGEIVRLELGADRPGLDVWELEGWDRGMRWADTGRPWIAPSPNIPTPSTANVYPGVCLVEGTRVSEGRGTTRPFRLVGAPALEPRALAAELAALGLPGLAFVPSYFRPQFHKHAAERCGGFEIVVTAPEVVRPYRAGVEIAAALHRRLGSDLWRQEAYEFEVELPAIDLLAGTDELRRRLEAGDALDPWLATWPADEATFRERRRPALLYPEAER